MKVLEILKWKSKNDATDQEMIDAVNNMVPDLKKLDGFINQTLYKDENNTWVDIYYWDTKENAHLSNERMAEKNSLKTLLNLIDLDTITIEILEPLQSSE